jgi:hypothetical protein
MKNAIIKPNNLGVEGISFAEIALIRRVREIGDFKR